MGNRTEICAQALKRHVSAVSFLFLIPSFFFLFRELLFFRSVYMRGKVNNMNSSLKNPSAIALMHLASLIPPPMFSYSFLLSNHDTYGLTCTLMRKPNHNLHIHISLAQLKSVLTSDLS